MGDEQHGSMSRRSMGSTLRWGQLKHPALPPTLRNPGGHSRATSHMAQFQMKGSVPNRALTPGTFKCLKAEAVSGRLYR
jgi:hypothetical protein